MPIVFIGDSLLGLFDRAETLCKIQLILRDQVDQKIGDQMDKRKSVVEMGVSLAISPPSTCFRCVVSEIRLLVEGGHYILEGLYDL